jgi:Putative Flp pilus-assembly TadE/G-like
MRGERGQILVLTAVMMASLLGLGAMVIDVGVWFRAKRQLQATADAAALAGAQGLPADPDQAESLALQYGASNGGGVSAGGISFESQWVANDTIVVHAHGTQSSYFAKVIGVGSQNIGAVAKARSEAPAEARYVAPIGVDKSHPLLSGSGCPCFDQSTTLDLKKVGPGAFRILNIDGSHGGTGQTILGDWINKGYDQYMGLDWYFSDGGAKFNASQVIDALQNHIDTELLFPVYDQTRAEGANFDYRVVGWVGFHLTGFSAQGNGGTLSGSFTSITWDGIQAQPPSEDFGAHSIQLIE